MSTKAKEIIDAICKKYGDIELAVNFPKDLSLKKMYDYLTSPDSILVREKLVWESPCLKYDDIYEREYEYYETLRKDIKKLENKINKAQKEISDNDPEKIALREEQKRLEMEKKKLAEQARQEELAKERNSLLDKILNMGRKIIG